MKSWAFLAATASVAIAGPAAAGEVSLGVYAHDIDDQIAIGHTEKGEEIIGQIKTAPVDAMSFIGSPRVHVLVGVNTRGGTDFAAAGFSWRFGFGNDRFYVEPGIGAAVHDGSVKLPSPFAPGITFAEQQKRLRDWETKLDLGSRVLFEPELALGWKATDRLSLELSWVHMSHAQLAGRQNPGLSELGVRGVYRYGVDR